MNAANATVLLIESDAEFASTIKQMLSALGYDDVVTAAGDEVERLVHHSSCLFTCVDVGSYGLRDIVSCLDAAATPYVLLSSRPREALSSAIQRATILTRPVSLSAFGQAIRTCLYPAWDVSL